MGGECSMLFSHDKRIRLLLKAGPHAVEPSLRPWGWAQIVGALCIFTITTLEVGRLTPARAADRQSPSTSQSVSMRSLVVTLNKSRTIQFDRPFVTAVVGSPDIADALPM